MSKNQQPKSKWFLGLSDKISTIPGGWDLSSLLTPKTSKISKEAGGAHQSDQESSPDQEAKMRADWQLDPYFDREEDPSRRDLSAY